MITLAERARQIDREEFAAECSAVRQRAYARLGMETPRDQLVERWIKRIEPKHSMRKVVQAKVGVAKAARTHSANAKLYTAFGHTRTLTEWQTATGMSKHTIRNRITLGWTVEDAVTRAVQGQSNKEPINGTV